MRRPRGRQALAALLAATLLAGCATRPDASARRAAEQRASVTCVRSPEAMAGTADRLVAAEAPRGALPTIPGFSRQAIETARDIGVLDELSRYAALLSEGATASSSGAAAAVPPARDPAGRLALLEARQRLGDRVLLALLDVQAVIAELECEQDRGERLKFLLEQDQARRDRRLALSGLIVGAATAIASGALSLAASGRTAADVVGIAGGSTEAGVGIAGLADARSATLRTERNVLREVWAGRPSSPRLLPSLVWRLLDAPGPDGQPSIRETLVAAWRDDHALEATGPGAPDARRRIELLFGAGGEYSADDLQMREILLDSLQPSVWLISLELERLLREVIGAAGAPR